MSIAIDKITDLGVAYEKLEEAIANIESNEEWINYLNFQSRFPSYSFGNTMMIFMQRPTSTLVAGYNKWKEFDRFVKKGEQGIKIFAPISQKLKKEVDGEETKTIFLLKGFKLVTVFDLSQTDGSDEKLPTLVKGLESQEGDEETYIRLKSIIDIPVSEFDSLSAKGVYSINDKSIAIKSSLSYSQKVKTLIHEYAHHMHLTEHFGDESYDAGEVIAESVAFIVSSHLGIDSSDYSFGYVKGWARDVETVKSVGHKVQIIAKSLIEKL